MYKNWEELFEAIQEDWRYEGEKYIEITVDEKANYVFLKNIPSEVKSRSLADIFDDKAKGNAIECLTLLRHKGTCTRGLKQWEAELRHAIFCNTNGSKLDRINAFMKE